MAHGSSGIEAVRVVLCLGTGGCLAGGAADDVGVSEQAIIGGESSDPGEYPATGALMRGLAYRCTATLIAPDVVVTAAHCLDGDGWGDFGFTLSEDVSDDPGEIVRALIVHQHPEFHVTGDEYMKIGKRNDVGVVVLEEPIYGVAFEKLETEEARAELSQGMELSMCGYGRDSWSSSLTSGRKRDAVVSVNLSTVWELQSVEENPQPCRGDSGGPVFADTPNGRRIVGLVSRAAGGSRMCDTGAIYTRVATYADWIWEASRDREAEGCSAGRSRGWAAPLFLSVLAFGLGRVRRRRRAAAQSRVGSARSVSSST